MCSKFSRVIARAVEKENTASKDAAKRVICFISTFRKDQTLIYVPNGIYRFQRVIESTLFVSMWRLNRAAWESKILSCGLYSEELIRLEHLGNVWPSFQLALLRDD